MTTLNLQDRPDAGWHFDNTYARLPDAFHVRLNPVPVRDPQLVVFNAPLARHLGLDPDVLAGDEGAAIFAGNTIPQGAEPLAQAYAGHQFGSFTMLGDGRAVLLGEQITPQGERFDIQYKGSGKTPFSRQGDGRAALGPMLREYIISEALHALGIPTTRSLAVVTTGEPVFRETVLDGSILTRTAASHIRVGTFEYAATRGAPDDLRTLADYTIRRHFPDLAAHENPYLALLEAVIERQAALVALWLQVGFYMIGITDPDLAADVAVQVDSTFKNSLAETLTETEKSFQLSFISMTEAIVVAIQLVSFVIILIIMAVVANTMAMTARERIGEYAVFKTLGFSGMHIYGLVFGESVCITMMGAFFGIACTFPVARILRETLSQYFPIFNVPPETVVLDLVASFLIAFVAALFPTWRAITIPIADGLRRVG